LGWSGSYDGWYASNNIVTGSYNWSDVNYQGAVIGIAPSGPSCPSLYFWNGNDYEKRGYIFPGAVDPATKYADNISLNRLVPKIGQYYSLEYSLQIREEEPENSFIDMAKLIVVDPGSGVNFMELYPTGALKVKSSISAGSISTVEDVTYQVFSSDGQYVSLGKGDMIILTFPYFPQVQGQMRDFIFVVEGFHVALDPVPEQKEVCSNWARIAVAQNEENLTRACGFIGPQWNSDYNNHFQFCLSVPWDFAISAKNAREYDLRNRCRGY